MFKKLNNSVTKSLFLFCFLFTLSYFGFSVVLSKYGSNASFLGTTVTPSVTAVNVPLEVSSSQEGTVNKTFNNGSIVNINVPKGSVASQTTFDVKLGVLNYSKPKMVDAGINLVGDNIYTISAKDIGGSDISSFSQDLVFEFIIPDMPMDVDSLSIYYFNNQNKWIKISNSRFDYASKKVWFSANHLTDFAILENNETFLSVDSVSNKKDEEVKGVVVEKFGDVDSLYDLEADIVEQVSLSEAKEIDTDPEYVLMSQDSKQVYSLVMGGKGVIEKNDKYSIAHFIHSGTKTTRALGEGERGGVLNSYYSTYRKMPQTYDEWQDVMKIANGRWPSNRNLDTESSIGVENFRKIYQREPDMSNENDNAAVMIISYGLRPRSRSFASELVAIEHFESIYAYEPNNARDWDIVRAIAYSGATR